MLEEEYERRRTLPAHLRKQPEPEPPFSFVVRDAVDRDLPDVREIYNHYVANSTVTLYTVQTVKQGATRRWVA